MPTANASPHDSNPMNAQDYDISTLLVVPLFQIIAGVLLFIALLNAEYALALLTLLLFCTVIGTKLWSRAIVKHILWQGRVEPTRLFPGESLTLDIHVENSGWLPIWLQIGVTANGPFSAKDHGMAFTQESGLLWYQQVDFQWAFTAQRRGVYSLGATSMRTGDLFGFFPQDRSLSDSREIVVYPRLIPLAPVALFRHAVWGIPGASHPIHDPVYMLGTREYHHSQPARYIHWKASARYDRLHEKLFEASEQEKILLLLDVAQFTVHNATEAFEQTLEVIASLGVQLLRQGCAVGCVTNSRLSGSSVARLPMSSAPQQAAALLELLARAEMEEAEALTASLIRGAKPSWGVSCLYFTFRSGETSDAISNVLQQRRVPTVFVVYQRSDEMFRHNGRGKMYCVEDLCQKIASDPP